MLDGDFGTDLLGRSDCALWDGSDCFYDVGDGGDVEGFGVQSLSFYFVEDMERTWFSIDQLIGVLHFGSMLPYFCLT